jgi:PAS domain S-box-containing protein
MPLDQTDANRLELILESMVEGWWEWDVNTNKSYHSPGWYKMLGIQPSDAPTYESWVDLMHPDDREAVQAKQKYFLENRTSWEIEFRMKTIDGSYKWIQSRGRVIERDQQGQVVKVVGVHVDIEDRKQLEMAEREKEIQQELLDGIIRVTQSSLNIYDFLGKRLVFSTGHILEKMDYSRDEFYKLSENYFSELIHPDDRQNISEHVRKIIYAKPGQTHSTIFRLADKKGNYHTILLKDSVFRTTEDGFPLRIVGSAVDITQYQELKKKMEESIQFLESLSYKNSHALRGPVASVLGLVHIIKDQINSKEDLQEVLVLLERTVLKMDDVIRNFDSEIKNHTNK